MADDLSEDGDDEELPDYPVAATHRQVIPVGTVQEVLRMQPPVTQLEADDLDIARYHHQYSDQHVQAAATFVDRSGVAEYMVRLHRESKDPRGAKEEIPFRAVLTGLWLIATDGGNLWMSNLRDVLFHRISARSRKLLGITYPDRPTPPAEQSRNDQTSEADRHWDDASERTVARTFQRMLKTVDPSIHPKNRIMSWQDLSESSLQLTVGQQQKIQARLDWVCNRLLETALKTLPREIRRKWRGSACIDATPLPLYSVGRSKIDRMCSSDPDGGFYGRQYGHDEPNRLRDAKWALDISLLTLVDCRPGDRQHVPALPLAMAVDRPAMDPSGAARRMFAYVKAAGYPVRWLAGDLLYTDQKPEKFQSAAREIGYRPVLGYGPKHHGLQGSHHTGMHMIEGAFACPAMPDDLVNATVLRRTKDKSGKPMLSHEQWQQAMADRGPYLMRRKERAANGLPARLACPASGANPVAACPLKPASMRQRRTLQANGVVADARLQIDPTGLPTGRELPTVCAQHTVTLRIGPDEDIARYIQELRYGSPTHTRIYVRLRQSQEGLHGFAKEQAVKALGDAGARRVRGRAAQSLFAAVLLAAASVAKVRNFLHRAQTDPSGTRWVEREPLNAAWRTPPGHEPPEPPPPDPPPQDLPAGP